MHKEYRLIRQQDFNRVFQRGRSAANRQFVVYYRPAIGHDHFRLGISVSKKVGNAVVRNRIRRKVKEIFRSHAEELTTADMVLIARKPAADMDYHAMEKSILHVLRRASLLKSGQG